MMNFELTDRLIKLLADDRINEAIVLAEFELRQQAPSDFNKLLGKDLLHQTDALIEFVTNFYGMVKDNLKVSAIYAEMNGFTINYDRWFLDLFAYDSIGTTNDPDWLADWDDGNCTSTSFHLTSFEELQDAYRYFVENEGYKDAKLNAASQVAELLIVLRLQELAGATAEEAKRRNLEWALIPLFASAHDYDLIYEVKQAQG